MPSTPTHVLELNGRRYNAMTGQLLSGPASKSVDGFLPPRPQQPSGTTTQPKPLHNAPAPPSSGQAMDIQRSSSHHAMRHPVQHSHTLMRQAVRHPAHDWKRHNHAASHTGALVGKIHFDIVPKHSAQLVDEARLHRAKKIAKSGLVRRFTQQAVAPRLSTAHPAPQQSVTTPTPSSGHRTDDVFERALAAVGQHEAPAVKKKPSRAHRLRQITSIAASSLAILLILGFVAYQNQAVIQLRLASSRAGVNATLPAWQPAGFHLGTFAYAPGSVTVKYNDPASGHSFNIVQTASNWDSNSLLSNFVYPNNDAYNTLTSNGTTIYTYGSNNATWVNGGIWYRLTSDTTLSSQDVANIATSM